MSDIRGSYNVIHLTINDDGEINASFCDLVKAVKSGATVDMIMMTDSDGTFSSYLRETLVNLQINDGVYMAIFYNAYDNLQELYTATDINALMHFTEEP